MGVKAPCPPRPTHLRVLMIHRYLPLAKPAYPKPDNPKTPGDLRAIESYIPNLHLK